MPFVPNHLNTSAGSINNIRMRVNDVRKAGCTFDSPQAHATLSCKGLDKGEMADFATESALTMSRECLREVLQNLEQSWKVEACLQKMKDTDPYFDFRIHQQAEGAPIGVAWITLSVQIAWI
jgi:hypothetical protein